MTYDKIVETIREQGHVSANDVSGVQTFMLLHDRVIKTIEYHHIIYEINFIPVDYTEAEVWLEVNDDCCPDFRSTTVVVENMMTAFSKHQLICMNLDGELFDLAIEVLETYE